MRVTVLNDNQIEVLKLWFALYPITHLGITDRGEVIVEYKDDDITKTKLIKR